MHNTLYIKYIRTHAIIFIYILIFSIIYIKEIVINNLMFNSSLGVLFLEFK